ncbi:C39 family peptidase [Luteolibacter ambystomatis]|uniref:C39 family peptidase n=1 Tax=Luteolibacter ambystomatis TaxID=2824561 RepID=A0A975IY96_9BACT|nr:C39 family peptidase [Luteolibacter ambystomatis]QUE50161.1 C39 family peptidase [Luteolibacter ambystomatis]
MKTQASLALAFALLAIPIHAEPAAPPAIDGTLTDGTLFAKPIKDLMPSTGGFAWLSDKKDGLRANANRWTLFGEKTGEIVIRGDDTKTTSVSVSLYNRGDDGEISVKDLEGRFEDWKKRISTGLGNPGEVYAQRSAVNLKGWMWKKDKSAWLLESSVSRGDGAPQAEFLRLRLASLDTASAKAQVVKRASLTDHIVKKDTGDVYIDGVPMVDQGQKGYCAVATAERVARYYGLEVDQHEMAQVAKTGENGTSMAEMEEALKRITGRLHISTTKRFDYDAKQYEEDVRDYNIAAKREGAAKFEPNPNVLDVSSLQQNVKPEVFLAAKVKQSGYKRFLARIQEAVDKGIPVSWSLQLGMFKEAGLPQTHGGHMRLIIGYNTKTQEIIYSDSWGAGHEMKRMPAGQAWCMTMALYTMAPTW